MAGFAPEEIEKCNAAMSKPGPLDALRLIASGRVVIELTEGGRYVNIVELDGKRVRDPDYPDDPDRRVGLSGAWPLFRAGMIDEFGLVTDAGHRLLASQAPRP